jgi:hypothetical protein
LFDGFKSPTSLHNTYVEALPEAGPPNHGWTRR